MTPPPSLQDLIETVQQDSPSDDLLDLLVTASSTVSQLEDVNDALLGHFVDRCRRAGRSWSEISTALGVSKQAVHKRFSAAMADRIIEQTPHPSFERFTTRARAVLAAANSDAHALHRDHIGSEHLLLGLFAEPEGLAARALAAMNVSRNQVEAALPVPAPGSTTDPADIAHAEGAAGTGGTAGTGGGAAAPRLPFAPDAARVLRDALAEALEFGHNYIGTEHILLGLLRNPASRAAKLLGSLGVTPAETKVRISEMLRGFTKGPAAGA